MKLFLRAYKPLFYSRDMIIAKIKENVSETLREANYDGLFIVFIRTELLTKFVNVFGDEVVIKPSIYPAGSFIFGFPSGRNSCMMNTANISKFFYCQSTLFKFTFKVLIIHYLPLFKNIENFIKKLLYIQIEKLTYYSILYYNLYVKFYKIEQKESQ